MSRYVATYDVRDDLTRTRLSKVLEGYGVRLQHSVFEIDVEPHDLDRLLVRVGSLLSRRDLFDLIPIDRRPSRKRLHWGEPRSLGLPVDGVGGDSDRASVGDE